MTARALISEAQREVGAWVRLRGVHPVVRRSLRLQRGRAYLIFYGLFCGPLPAPIRHRVAAILLRRTGLFDPEYYLRANADVASANKDPFLHYQRYGDREGRSPMPLFDPRYYRARAGKASQLVNSFLHYAWIGRHQKLSPSAWFDTHYYLQHNRDVERRGFDPLVHYLRWGGNEGRSPNPSFDGSYYLRAYPELRTAGVNPLIHYIEYGRFEGRTTRQLDSEGSDDQYALDNDRDNATEGLVPGEWTLLEGRVCKQTQDAQVAVVLPVYRDRKLTWRCLVSVLTARCDTAFKLIVIDDKSPEAELSDDLLEMAHRGWIELIRNDPNQGFVISVNRGMQASAGMDVVLLNSDTEVYPGWLDRLRRAAYRHSKTASVTPLSNNATIASYPRFLHDNPYPLETPYSVLDSFASKVNANEEVEVPTGIGFCMYLRHDALEEIGLFDEKTFGKGYGEENDWCQRAIRGGWRNVIAGDVFVRHFGSASFQGEKAQRVAHAMKILNGRYPSYHSDVQSFIRQDPLRLSRERLDWARLEAHCRDENVLIVSHNRGGGAERHVQEDARNLLAEGKGVFFLRPVRGRPTHVRFAHPNCRQLLSSSTFALSDTRALSGALKWLRITSIHSQGLVDFSHDAAMHVVALSRALDVPLDVDIHDYKVICPQLNLADQHGYYCGEPDESTCNTCLTTRGNDFGATDIRTWRRMHDDVLRRARSIQVPDLDVLERLTAYFPEVNIAVSPHEFIDSIDLRPARNRKPDEPLHVVLIGAISRIKGYAILLACAKEAQSRRLPIRFSILGYSMDDRALETAGVSITGRYLESEAEERLHALKPDLVWLPAVWPETYSYTLSIAIRAGYPTLVFDIGAPAARLRRLGRKEWVIPFSAARSARETLQALLVAGSDLRTNEPDFPEGTLRA